MNKLHLPKLKKSNKNIDNNYNMPRKYKTSIINRAYTGYTTKFKTAIKSNTATTSQKNEYLSAIKRGFPIYNRITGYWASTSGKGKYLGKRGIRKKYRDAIQLKDGQIVPYVRTFTYNIKSDTRGTWVRDNVFGNHLNKVIKVKYIADNGYTVNHIYFNIKNLRFEWDNKIKNSKKIKWDWLRGPSGGNYFVWQQEGKGIMEVQETRQVMGGGRQIAQFFREGITNCLLTPIINTFKESLKKTNFKRKIKIWKNGIKTAIALRDKYAEQGVPETAIDDICHSLQIKINIDLPLCLNADRYLTFSCNKKPRKVFNYINSRFNHVEFNKNNIYTKFGKKETFIVEQEVLTKKLFNNLNGSDQTDICWKENKQGVSSINELNKVWKVDSKYNEVINEWERLDYNGVCFKDFKINAAHIYSDFILESVHYSNKSQNPDFKYPDDNHFLYIDESKSYTKFKQTKGYKGFVPKITDFFNMDNVKDQISHIKKNLGFYRIFNINYDDCDNLKLLEIFKIWKQPFKNNGVYWSPMLIKLIDNGITFEVTEGAWGNNEVFDFNFNDLQDENNEFSMYDKENGISHYAKWVGGCNSVSKFTNLHIKAVPKFLKVLKKTLPKDVQVFEVDEKCGIIRYPKKTVYHSSHFTAAITSYQRMRMIDQLLEMDISKIYKIDLDGILFIPHKFNTTSTFRIKSYKNAMITGLQWLDDHYTNHIKPDCEMYGKSTLINKVINNIPIDYTNDKRTVLIGCGGGGKTHNTLKNKSITNLGYIAPSWNLSNDKAVDTKKKFNYEIFNSVDARVYHDAHVINIVRYTSNILKDEISMNENSIKKFYDHPRFRFHKIYYAGDIVPGPNPKFTYQLSPVVTDIEKIMVNGNYLTTNDTKPLLAIGLNKVLGANIENTTFNYMHSSNDSLVNQLNRHGSSVTYSHYDKKSMSCVTKLTYNHLSTNNLIKNILNFIPNNQSLVRQRKPVLFNDRDTTKQPIDIKTQVLPTALMVLNKKPIHFLDRLICSYIQKSKNFLPPMKTIKYNFNYRAKNCPKQTQWCLQLRSMMERLSDKPYAKCIMSKFVIQKYISENQYIKSADVKNKFNIQDLILCSKNSYVDKYNLDISDKFKTKKKWQIKSNTQNFNNGQIIIGDKPLKCRSKESYGFTTHIIQGKDLKEDTADIQNNEKILLDLRRMFDVAMLYTAISRARSFNQVFIIYDEPINEEFTMDFGKYKYETYKWVIENDSNYVNWCMNTPTDSEDENSTNLKLFKDYINGESPSYNKFIKKWNIKNIKAPTQPVQTIEEEWIPPPNYKEDEIEDDAKSNLPIKKYTEEEMIILIKNQQKAKHELFIKKFKDEELRKKQIKEKQLLPWRQWGILPQNNKPIQLPQPVIKKCTAPLGKRFKILPTVMSDKYKEYIKEKKLRQHQITEKQLLPWRQWGLLN